VVTKSRKSRPADLSRWDQLEWFWSLPDEAFVNRDVYCAVIDSARAKAERDAALRRGCRYDRTGGKRGRALYRKADIIEYMRSSVVEPEV
jgi:hypothetical protein